MSLALTVQAAKGLVRHGADYVKGKGARCPACGVRMPVVSSGQKSEGARARYHKCRNERCALAVLCLLIKSVEE